MITYDVEFIEKKLQVRLKNPDQDTQRTSMEDLERYYEGEGGEEQDYDSEEYSDGYVNRREEF